jgi:hypothetical protein
MAGPVIMTQLLPNPESGTQTTNGSENSLASATVSGTYVLTLETASTTKRQTFHLSLSNSPFQFGGIDDEPHGMDRRE